MKFIKNIFVWIYANKKSLIGTFSGIVSGIIGAITINAGVIAEMPKLLFLGFNIVPIFAGILIFAGVEIGVVGKGFEFISTFKTRIESKNKIKAEQKALIESQKQIQNEKTELEKAKKIVEEYEKAKQIIEKQNNITA